MRFESFETERGTVFVNVEEVAAVEQSRDDTVIRLKDGHNYVVVNESAVQVWKAIAKPAERP